MKALFKLFITAICAATLFSCTTSEDNKIELLPVTINNISGNWTLVEFSGSPLVEGAYLDITFVRNDKTFVMTQNLDSFGDVPHQTTGEFNIVTDMGMSIIQGKYDHDGGLWAYDYIITDLTATSMTWTAVGDPDNVQKYVRK